MLQINKGHGVSIKKRQILSVDVKDVIGWLLNMQSFQIWTGVDQPWEDEVVSRNELQGGDVLPHVGYVGGLLGQRHVEFTSNAVGQRHLLDTGEHVLQVGHHLVDGHLHLILVLHRHRFHVVQAEFFQVKSLTGLVLHHRRTITTVVNLVKNASTKPQILQSCFQKIIFKIILTFLDRNSQS